MIPPTPFPPSKAEARCQQILDAACDCVRQAGFHGASMASIAEAAGLSVGQIYRYFENKEAIIAAIVAQDQAEMYEKFAEFENSGSPLIDTLIGHCGTAVDRSYDPARAALRLEVLAEAARNLSVAAIVREADAVEQTLGRTLLEKVVPPDCGAADISARCEVLCMLFDGMATRAVNHPAGDREAIARTVGVVMRCLLEAGPIGPPRAV